MKCTECESAIMKVVIRNIDGTIDCKVFRLLNTADLKHISRMLAQFDILHYGNSRVVTLLSNNRKLLDKSLGGEVKGS